MNEEASFILRLASEARVGTVRVLTGKIVAVRVMSSIQ